MSFFEEEELESLENEFTVIRTVLTAVFVLLFLKEAAQFVVNLYYEGVLTRLLHRFGQKIFPVLGDPSDPDRPDGNNTSIKTSESQASILPPKSETLEHDEKKESTQTLSSEKNEVEVCENVGEGCSSLIHEEEIDSDIDSDFVLVQNEWKMDFPAVNCYDSESSNAPSSSDDCADNEELFAVEDFGRKKFRGKFVGRPNFAYMDKFFLKYNNRSFEDPIEFSYE